MLRTLSLLVVLIAFVTHGLTSVAHAPEAPPASHSGRSLGYDEPKIKPKVVIISLFASEGSVWYNIPEFNLLAHNVTVPGLSPLFPNVHCTKNGAICQLTTGAAEINAALSMSALLYSPSFDLTSTYFLIAGIGGISPKLGTIGSVTFARFAVQVALQYEIDAREKPADFPTGYIPQGSSAPGQYPGTLYGTEVFEVNDALRKIAVTLAKTASLNDTAAAQADRARYNTSAIFASGAAPPSVVACDTATSDTFWSGSLLAEAFENTTALFTNGTGVYCTTQQEDNAVLAALLRGALWGAVQFSRVIVMRTGSDFDRQSEGQTATENLFAAGAGFRPALNNVYIAGVKVVEGIVEGWEKTFKQGVQPTNYVGDVLGSLSGRPDLRRDIAHDRQIVI
ncbi:purine nucleoside permease-like protein [Lyophyllum atratum]|nr:purine nucleoside permease-like protein [Lyophyllum atratum]